MKSFVREVTPGKQQPHPKVLRKSHPFLFTGWRICLKAVPTPSCHQGSTGGNPRLSRPRISVCIYSPLTFVSFLMPPLITLA